LVSSSNITRYNSAIFKTLTARQYSVFVVNESFFQGAAFNKGLQSYTWFGKPGRDNTTYNFGSGWVDAGPPVGQSLLQELQQRTDNLTRFSASECIAAYADDFLTSRGSLLAVTNSTFSTFFNNSAPSNSSLYGWSQANISNSGTGVGGPEDDPLVWMCAEMINYAVPCNLSFAQKAASDWTIFGYTIDHCLSEPKHELCTLEFSLVIMIVTIIANAVKAICMALTVTSFGAESPLVTIGYVASLSVIIALPYKVSKC
jgi:hypothetical protein